MNRSATSLTKLDLIFVLYLFSASLFMLSPDLLRTASMFDTRLGIMNGVSYLLETASN